MLVGVAMFDEVWRHVKVARELGCILSIPRLWTLFEAIHMLKWICTKPAVDVALYSWIEFLACGRYMLFLALTMRTYREE